MASSGIMVNAASGKALSSTARARGAREFHAQVVATGLFHFLGGHLGHKPPLAQDAVAIHQALS